MLALALALAVAVAWAAPPAHAWSPDGHRITGEVAWRVMAPKTKESLRALLRDETLADAAAWADRREVRGDPRNAWITPLHYVNVDPGATRVRVGRDCGCVVGAIEQQLERLRDPRESSKTRREALRLLAHFVGDVHQPLHVSHPDGRGGNEVDVVFDGRDTNLHRLWDGGLLERRLRELGRRRGGRWRAFAHALADRAPPADAQRWREARDPRAWADESLALARRHTFAVRDGDRLGDAYYEATRSAVAERLAQAGFRLAAALDGVFAPAAPVR